MTRKDPPRLRVVSSTDAPGIALPRVPTSSRNLYGNPWATEIGGTNELIGFVPGATTGMLEQWIHQGLVELHSPNPGRGSRPVRVAADVLQVTLATVFSGARVPLEALPYAWLVLRERAWFGCGPAGVIIFTMRDRGIDVRTLNEAEPPAADLPDVITTVRFKHLITRVARTIGIKEYTP